MNQQTVKMTIQKVQTMIMVSLNIKQLYMHGHIQVMLLRYL